MRARAVAAIATIATTAAIGATGCIVRSPLEATSSALVVHAVLNTVQDEQVVDVQRMLPGYQSGNAVDSALVTITGPDGIAMKAVEDTGKLGTRVYRIKLSLYHAQLMPGATYHLRVHLKSGEEVTGTTTIPNTQPLPDTRLELLVFNKSRDTLRLAWPSVQGAASYELRVQSNSGTFVMFADTSIVVAGNMTSLEGRNVFENGENHQITVSAVDVNYYQYYRSNSDEFTGAAVQGNLTGAQGVFGSLVIIAARYLHVTTN